MKALVKFVVLALLVTIGGMAMAEEKKTVDQQTPGKGSYYERHKMSGKPEAPVEIRWLADGRDGRVVLEIVSGVDQVGAVVGLAVPGEGRPRKVQLSAAQAGETQRVQWWLEAPAAHPPRVTVQIDTGASRMVRNAVAPWSRGKNSEILAEFESGGGKAPATPAKAESAVEED
ncbi:MAG: hypothetical protein PVI08_08035, partial [Gammaproteobacteria bacterium]